MGPHWSWEGCTFSQRHFSWRRVCWDEGLQYSSPILTTWGLATRKTKVQGLFLNTALWTWQQASRELWECLQCSKVFYVLQHVVNVVARVFSIVAKHFLTCPRHPSFYLSIHPTNHLSIYCSTYPSIHHSTHSSISSCWRPRVLLQ